MNLQLADKTALVSGSTAGIGKAIAESLAREGARVILNGRDDGRVEAAAADIRSRHPQARLDCVAVDLGSAEGVAQLVERVPSVDILVNNLGIFEPKAFEEISDADWFRFFDVNVMSGVRLSRAYLGGMRERNWGRVVFISSESAAQIPAEMIHYGMTKTAQLAISRGLAESLVGTAVTVNSVLVGPTRTEGVEVFVQQMADQAGVPLAEFEPGFLKSVRPTSLVQRFLEPGEIAEAVAFLCSPLASAITGSAMRVEGGLLKNVL